MKRAREHDSDVDGDEELEDIMTIRPVVVEKAKSGRSKCKVCGSNIAKGVLRVKVVDAREFSLYCGADGEHWGRPYYGEHGIDIKSYFQHLTCYHPHAAPVMHAHTKEFYTTKALRGGDKVAFEEWFSSPKISAVPAVLTCLLIAKYRTEDCALLGQIPNELLHHILRLVLEGDAGVRERRRTHDEEWAAIQAQYEEYVRDGTIDDGITMG